MKIQLYRPCTGTRLVVDSPIELSDMPTLPMHICQYLNSWVSWKYHNFELSGFISENNPEYHLQHSEESL